VLYQLSYARMNFVLAKFRSKDFSLRQQWKIFDQNFIRYEILT